VLLERVPRAAAYFIAIGALGACSSAAETSTEPQETARVDFVFGRGDGAYEASLVDPLMEKCLGDAGFEYTADPVDRVDVNSREYAEQHGFGLQSGETTTAEVPSTGMSESQKVAFERTYGECRSKAEEVVEGERDRLSQLISPEQMDELASVIDGTHPDLAGTADRWKDCMHDRGFDASQSSDLIDQFVADYAAAVNEADRADVLQRERAAAVANYDCLEESGAQEVVQSLLFRIEQTISIGLKE